MFTAWSQVNKLQLMCCISYCTYCTLWLWISRCTAVMRRETVGKTMEVFIFPLHPPLSNLSMSWNGLGWFAVIGSHCEISEKDLSTSNEYAAYTARQEASVDWDRSNYAGKLSMDLQGATNNQATPGYEPSNHHLHADKPTRTLLEKQLCFRLCSFSLSVFLYTLRHFHLPELTAQCACRAWVDRKSKAVNQKPALWCMASVSHPGWTVGHRSWKYLPHIFSFSCIGRPVKTLTAIENDSFSRWW